MRTGRRLPHFRAILARPDSLTTLACDHLEPIDPRASGGLLRCARLVVSMAGNKAGEMRAKAPRRLGGSLYGRMLSGFGPGWRRCQGDGGRECADHGADG